MAQVELLKDLILNLAREDKWSELRNVLIGQHPADIAEVIAHADSDIRGQLFASVEEKAQPDVLSELEGRAESDILDGLTNDEISDLIEEMPADDAADIIADLPEERSEIVLDLMEDDESEDVRELLKYDEDSAGGIMTTDVVTFDENLTVNAAIEKIAYIEDDEPFYYAYVVDSNQQLVGYIGLWELLKVRDRSQQLSEVAHREFRAATTDMDQEEVAKLMSKYDLTAMPVVNIAGAPVGRITVDDVMDVLEEEASEDLFRMAGSDDAELTYTSPLRACKVRLPWLLITLASGFAASLILKKFMVDLSEVLALSFFVPIVMAMGGNTGIQASILVVRRITLGTLHGKSVSKILLREVAAGAIMGAVCGLIIGGWAHFVIATSPTSSELYSPSFLAGVVSLALLTAMTFAATFGAFAPIMLNKFKADPAVASGPFVAAANDICALIIYYGVTVALLALHPA